jgi:hypothetical protein
MRRVAVLASRREVIEKPPLGGRPASTTTPFRPWAWAPRLTPRVIATEQCRRPVLPVHR